MFIPCILYKAFGETGNWEEEEEQVNPVPGKPLETHFFDGSV